MKHAITETDLLKDVYGQGPKSLGESLKISENRLKRCWHAIGKVLRQQLLEMLGERWTGGAVLVGCIGWWSATRRAEDDIPVMRFVMNKAFAEACAVKGETSNKCSNTRELDLHHIELLTRVPHERLTIIIKSLFCRLGDLAQSDLNAALPHLGRFESRKRTLSFIFAPDLLSIVDTRIAKSATPAFQPEEKVISSVQHWLQGQDTSSLPRTSSSRRPSSVITASSMWTSSKGTRTSHGETTASARAALKSVMMSAYERHEAAIAKQQQDDKNYNAYVTQKWQEADEHEKAASLCRKELIKRTSEALGMQVSERRKRGGNLTFLKDNVIENSLVAPLPIPQVCFKFIHPNRNH
eukprot:TRINITY_DN6287_c0_g1_i2.p1 TRINITY_DN6287_c0_g1~~TRINITY_DN6287_c0_g1_i2.p1  ORF type:complete len:353 (+),score=84.43 TRINITY_DN6287_c0_g1_i2:32-1090(+)